MPPSIPPTPGQGFLRVTGILYIVLAGLAVLIGLVMIVTVDFWVSATGGAGVRDVWILYYVIGMIHALYRVFIGLMGITNCRNTQRAGTLRTIGISDIAVGIISYGFIIFVGIYSYVTWLYIGMGLLITFALPVLYVVGAVKNRKAFQNGR